jgi:hypothetical protein
MISSFSPCFAHQTIKIVFFDVAMRKPTQSWYEKRLCPNLSYDNGRVLTPTLQPCYAWVRILRSFFIYWVGAK